MSNRNPKRQPKMSARDAYEMADAMDMPDGATFAMAAELAGMDVDNLCAELADEYDGGQS